jgi:ERCC4-type nuclease
MKIIIDTRETALISAFEQANYEFIRQDLSKIGDILFLSDDQTTIIRCYERKTIQDLFSSLYDKRAINQIIRMLNDFSSEQIWYIFEYTLNDDDIRNKPCIDGFMTLLDSCNIHRIHTNDVVHTAKILENTKRKMEEREEISNNSYVGLNFRDLLQSKKKQCYSAVDVQLAQFCMYPNVSSERAHMFLKHYGTLTSFLNAAMNNPNQTINEIKKFKKLGQKNAEKIIKMTKI